MANFNTHIFAAAGLASVAATVTAKLLNMPPETAVLFTLCGTIGGIAPDIDLKYSLPSKLLFSVLAGMLALTLAFAHMDSYTVTELVLGAVGIFLLVRYPVWGLFHQLTVHRGALHSVAAAMMFSFATAAAGEKLFGLAAIDSWLSACFMFGGCMVHLVLDEIYSVDFMGARIKRSFGSALKIVDAQRVLASCAVLFVSLVLWIWTPPIGPLVDLVDLPRPTMSELFVPDWVRLR